MNDMILISAQNYINSVDDKVIEFRKPRTSIRSKVFSRMASSKVTSQHKLAYVFANLRREEIEKQNEATICLANQKKQM